MSNNWRPDWKDEKANYNRLNNETSNETYAWEFLRRNPIYQEDFELNKDLIKNNQFYFVKRQYMHLNVNAISHWNEDMRDWYGLGYRSDNYDPSIDTPPTFQELGEFNPLALYAPHATEPANKTEPVNNKKEIIFLSELPEITQPDEFKVCLSTDFDWKEQEKKIHEAFKLHKKKLAKSTPLSIYYVMFLRTLDALYDGLSPAEIFQSCIYNKSILAPSEVTEYIKKAEELRDGGYIRIVDRRIENPRPEIDSYDPITLEIKLKSKPLRLLIRPDLSVNQAAYLTRVSWKNFFTRSGDFSRTCMCSVVAAFSLALVRTGTFV